ISCPRLLRPPVSSVAKILIAARKKMGRFFNGSPPFRKRTSPPRHTHPGGLVSRRVGAGSGCLGALDLQRRGRDTAALGQHLSRCRPLAVDADQVITGATIGYLLRKELPEGGSFGDFDLIGVTGTAVVEEEDFAWLRPCSLLQ